MTLRPNGLLSLKSGDVVTWFMVTVLSPVQAGVAVAVCGAAFVILAAALNVLTTDAKRFGYLDNISLSLALLTIVPVAVAAVAHYYGSLPAFIEALFAETGDERLKNEFSGALGRRFNTRWYAALIVSVGLPLELVYASKMAAHDAGGRCLTWVHRFDREFKCQGWIAGEGSPFTLGDLNWLAWAVWSVEMILAFYFMMFVCRAIAMAVCLNELFMNAQYRQDPVPLHPDGACGLSHVRDRIMSTMFIISLLGMGVALYVVDKILIQGGSIMFMGTIVLTTVYVGLAPVLLFYSLNSAHVRMKVAKERFLGPLSALIQREIQAIARAEELGKERLERLAELRRSYDDLLKQIPVWPLDVRTLRDFLQGILLPLAPAVIAILSQLFGRVGFK